MRLLLLLAAFVAFTVLVVYAKPPKYNLSLPAAELFKQWKRTHRKLARRPNAFKNFKANIAKMKKLNAKNKNAKFGPNSLSHLSSKRFKDRYLRGLKIPNLARRHKRAAFADYHFPRASARDIANLPSHLNWDRQGTVANLVRDQGQCGTCWIFSALGNIEGQLYRAQKKRVDLSEQWVLNCAREGAGDCHKPAWMDLAYNTIKNRGGVPEEWEIKYEASPQKCNIGYGPKHKIKGFKYILPEADQIAAFVAKNGPVVVAINSDMFQNYNGGIIEASACGAAKVNHAVLIVGFGTSGLNGGPNGQGFGPKIPYWIVRNSWGSGWGSAGYVYVRRGPNVCHINEFAMSAEV